LVCIKTFVNCDWHFCRKHYAKLGKCTSSFKIGVAKYLRDYLMIYVAL